MIRLKVLCKSDMPNILKWRNEVLETLRTPIPLTIEQQEEFYINTVCNRLSRNRYWGIHTIIGNDSVCIGMCGLEGIEWENGLAEISIIIDSNYRNKGIGEEVVKQLLYEGFNNMRLENIWGECYYCNRAIKFWERIAEKYKADTAVLKSRKFRDEKYWDSLYFVIHKDNFKEEGYEPI